MVGLKNVALFAASIILPASITWAAPIIEVETKPIPEKYIVLLKPHADLEGHLSWAKDVHARSLSRRDTAGVHKAWSVGSKFKAYAGEFDEETLKIIQRDERNVCLTESARIKQTPEYLSTLHYSVSPNQP